jgi:hypothetical protein
MDQPIQPEESRNPEQMVEMLPEQGSGSDPATGPTDGPIEDDSVAEGVLRRIRRTSVAAYLAFCPLVIYLDSWRGFLGLTCSAAVVMINFLWLEEIVTAVLQPGPHLHAWRLTLRALARFALLGVATLVTILVARFNAVSVLLGFSILVVGIFGEAVYSLRRSFGG